MSYSVFGVLLRLLRHELINALKQLMVNKGVSNLVSEIIITLITLSISVLLLNTFMSVDTLSTHMLNDVQEGDPIVELVMVNHDDKYVVLYNAHGVLSIIDVVPVKNYKVYVFDKDSNNWYESDTVIEGRLFLIKISEATTMPQKIILVTTRGLVSITLDRS